MKQIKVVLWFIFYAGVLFASQGCSGTARHIDGIEIGVLAMLLAIAVVCGFEGWKAHKRKDKRAAIYLAVCYTFVLIMFFLLLMWPRPLYNHNKTSLAAPTHGAVRFIYKCKSPREVSPQQFARGRPPAAVVSSELQLS